MTNPTNDKLEIETVNTLEDGRPQYRLGDAVVYRHTLGGRMALDYVALNPQHFSDTFLYEYASRIDRSDPDPQWEILRSVVFKQSQMHRFERPQADELVIHLRLGDVKGYKLPAGVLVDYAMDLVGGLNTQINKIRIVTALHFGRSILENKKHDEYVATNKVNDTKKVRQIIRLFSERSMKADLYSHPNIDRDFSFLAHSKFLLMGNGHFSLCAAMISEARCFIPPWANIEPKYLEALTKNNSFIGCWR